MVASAANTPDSRRSVAPHRSVTAVACSKVWLPRTMPAATDRHEQGVGAGYGGKRGCGGEAAKGHQHRRAGRGGGATGGCAYRVRPSVCPAPPRPSAHAAWVLLYPRSSRRGRGRRQRRTSRTPTAQSAPGWMRPPGARPFAVRPGENDCSAPAQAPIVRTRWALLRAPLPAMTQTVLVMTIAGIHGIGQEYSGGYQLKSLWFDALRDGLVAAGHPPRPPPRSCDSVPRRPALHRPERQRTAPEHYRRTSSGSSAAWRQPSVPAPSNTYAACTPAAAPSSKP